MKSSFLKKGYLQQCLGQSEHVDKAIDDDEETSANDEKVDDDMTFPT
ncbi:219_t:CDS:1, partial [Entrophospora sp. SA101]